MTDLPIILVISLLSGVTLACLAWSCRGLLLARYRKDAQWLQDAIWRFTPEEFDPRPWVLGHYAFSLASLVALVVFLPLPVALFFWVVLVFLPRWIINSRWEKRRKQIDGQLAAAVLQMAQSVAAGMTLAQAMERLAERLEDPIKTEFRVMANYWRLGADIASTIEDAKRRLRLENFNLFASALLINQKLGGNIIETLERLGRSLEGIDRMKQEVYAATSEGRTNIKVLAAAPFIMLSMTAVMDFEAVTMLFTTPAGWALLGVAAALVGAGTLWAWRIVHADI